MAEFRTEILGPSDKQLECENCNFIEQELIRWKKHGTDTVRVSCRECHVYEDPLRYKGQFKMVFENKMNSVSIANMSRMVAAFVHAKLWSDEVAHLVSAFLQQKELPEITGLGFDGEEQKKMAAAVVLWLKLESHDDDEVIEDNLLNCLKDRIEKIGAILSKVIYDDEKVVRGNWEDIEAARQLMTPDEERIFDWSVRYIPVTFDPERAKSWTYLRNEFFNEMLSVSKLHYRLKDILKTDNGSTAPAVYQFEDEPTSAIDGKGWPPRSVGTQFTDFLFGSLTDAPQKMEGKNEEN